MAATKAGNDWPRNVGPRVFCVPGVRVPAPFRSSPIRRIPPPLPQEEKSFSGTPKMKNFHVYLLILIETCLH